MARLTRPRRPKAVAQDHGTPETARKLRRDVVEELGAARRLGHDEMSAARDIRLVWDALGRSMFPSRELDRALASGPGYSGAIHPEERMTGPEARAWRQRYLPWVGMLGQVRPVRGGPTAAQLAIAMVVDNWTPRQAEDEFGMRHGTAVRWLRAALHGYAVQAGWARAYWGGWARPARSFIRRVFNSLAA